jgi:diguanylate cyclase (GGDEF)-like protein
MLIVVIAFIDFYTGHQWSFSIFYLFPIMWITWQTGKTGGIIYSVLSAFAWLEADLLAQHLYDNAIIPYWNALMRLGMFIIITLILSALKRSLENEKFNSRTDHLTKMANSKAFMEILQQEADRGRRYERQFSIAYVDVDNFKEVNDRWGHQAGDALLQKIANLLRSAVRQTDHVGRMGGDEFCILFPETDQKNAEEVLGRLMIDLEFMSDSGKYPIGFSIGCVTFINIPHSIDEIIQKADDLMYEVKKHGKNRVRYSEFAG